MEAKSKRDWERMRRNLPDFSFLQMTECLRWWWSQIASTSDQFGHTKEPHPLSIAVNQSPLTRTFLSTISRPARSLCLSVYPLGLGRYIKMFNCARKCYTLLDWDEALRVAEFEKGLMSIHRIEDDREWRC